VRSTKKHVIRSARFWARRLAEADPSAWNAMHQQPPKTPSWRATSAAKSGHVVSFRALTRARTHAKMSAGPDGHPQKRGGV
jgi:hypothetical protein